VKPEVLEKIKKILALAVNNPNEEEAALAAAKARELLDKYNLSIKDLKEDMTIDNIEDCYIKIENGIPRWNRMLLYYVALYNDCTFYHHNLRDGYGMSIVGHNSDIEVFEYTYKYLKHMVEVLKSEVGIPAGMKIRNYHDSYCYGIVEGLWNRMRKDKEKTTSTGDSRALMVIDRKKAVDKWCDENLKLRSGRGSSLKINYSAYAKGVADSVKIVLRKGVRSDGNGGNGILGIERR
jgi:hypothetical protein